MIKCSPVRFLVEDVQLAERAPESCYPVDGQLIPRFLLQVVENLHGCEPFAFFALLRATEMAKEKFFQWVLTICFELGFEKFVIGIAYYIFQKVLLLYLYELHFQFLLFCKFQILIDTLQPKVHRLWLKVLHQVSLICQEVLLVYFSIMIEEIL